MRSQGLGEISKYLNYVHINHKLYLNLALKCGKYRDFLLRHSKANLDPGWSTSGWVCLTSLSPLPPSPFLTWHGPHPETSFCTGKVHFPIFSSFLVHFPPKGGEPHAFLWLKSSIWPPYAVESTSQNRWLRKNIKNPWDRIIFILPINLIPGWHCGNPVPKRRIHYAFSWREKAQWGSLTGHGCKVGSARIACISWKSSVWSL